jgi:ligand-binding sensor domain-containing protein
VFSTENGLPHNRVNRIYLDAKGFLWVCTDDGLARFDGHQFVNYTMAHGLPHKHVNAVLETRNGEFWVATDGGISRFDPRPGRTRFMTYAPAGSDESSHVNALLESSDGSLLVGTSSGLYRFLVRAETPVFERIEFAHSRTAWGGIMVNALAQDGRGALWLGTDDGLYRRKANAEWAHYGTESGLSADRRGGDETHAFVNSFSGDRNGRLWIAFKGGFGRISSDPEPGASVLDFVQREQPGLSHEDRALWFGSDGRRWVATESAFCEWITGPDGVSSFREHNIQEGLPREAFLSVHEDALGNLWVGTRRSGLVQVGPSRFHTIDVDEGLRFGLDQLLLQTKSGQVYVFDSGHKTAQLYRWDGGRRFTAIRPALPHLGSTGLQMAMEDDRGAWWFSTASGLFRFTSPDKRFNLRLLPDFEVSRFFEDSVGDIWIAHWPKLARWERRSGVIHDESDRLPRDARPGITAFAQDHGGTMWIGLSDGSLLRLIDGKFQRLSASWSGHVNKLFVDSKGRLWATSTESGLGLIDDPQSPDPQVRRFTRAHGLSADEVWSVTEDRLGRIYAGTSKGVDRVDPGTGAIMHYSTADGLVRGDIRSSLRDRNGDLWFASAHGVSRYKPSEDRATTPARTRITALRIAGIPAPLSEFGEAQIGPLRVPSHQRSLQIDFAATDCGASRHAIQGQCGQHPMLRWRS